MEYNQGFWSPAYSAKNTTPDNTWDNILPPIANTTPKISLKYSLKELSLLIYPIPAKPNNPYASG